MKHDQMKFSTIETSKVLGGYMFTDATNRKCPKATLKLNPQAAKVGATKGGGSKEVS